MTVTLAPLTFRYGRNSHYNRTDPVFGGHYNDSMSWTTINFGFWNYRDSVSNPNWRQLIARGLNASSAYARQRVRASPLVVTSDSFGYPTYDKRYPAYGHAFSVFSVDPCGLYDLTDDVGLRDLALTRLKRKLSTQSAQVNSLVPAAELKEMRGLIRTTAQSGTDLVKSLLWIRKTKGMSAYRYAADKWLTWSFAVKPLIKDTQDISRAIAEHLNHRDRSVRLTGTASKTWNSSSKGTRTHVFGSSYFAYRLVASHELSYRYTGAFNINLKSANNYGLSDQLGIEFGNLIPAFWELIPYSWLVDYFTNVGAYLDDTFSSPPGDLKYLVLNKRYRYTSLLDGSSVPLSSGFPSPWLVEDHIEPGSAELLRFERSSLATLPHIGFRFKSADEVGLNAVNKLLNLASLLVTHRRI